MALILGVEKNVIIYLMKSIRECFLSYIVLRPPGYKTFFMFNSVEHEISNAHKYKKIKKFGFFRLR